MKANSLALRLFVTAAAWVLLVLPIAGWILYTLQRVQVVETFNNQIWRDLNHIIDAAEQGGRRTRCPRRAGQDVSQALGPVLGPALASQAVGRQAGRR